MMKQILYFSVVVFFSASSISMAASLDVRLKLCLEGKLNKQEATELVADLAELKTTFSTYVSNNAGACFTKLTNSPSEFLNGTGIVTSGAEIEKAKNLRIQLNVEEEERKKEKAKVEEKIKDLIEASRVDRRKEKCRTLELLNDADKKITEYENALSDIKITVQQETIKTCVDWAREDRRASITNPVCNSVFNNLGLPEDINDITTVEKRLFGLQAKLLRPLYEETLQAIRQIEIVSQDPSAERRLVLARLEEERLRSLREVSAEIDVCDERWELWIRERNYRAR